MGEPIERKCKECGAKLVFAEGPSGKVLPLQRVRSVYRVENGHAARVAEIDGAYVSHFETCSNPARFSRAR